MTYIYVIYPFKTNTKKIDWISKIYLYHKKLAYIRSMQARLLCLVQIKSVSLK